MFRDEDQIRECCDILLTRAGLPNWWGKKNISQAYEFLSSPRPSRAQRALVGTAFALWSGEGNVCISALLDLDTRNIRAVASLLVAVREGPEAVDRWIELASQGQIEPPRPATGATPPPALPRHLQGRAGRPGYNGK